MDLGLTNYEINQQLMANEKPIDPILLNRKLSDVAKDICKWKYGMLLCRERNDYNIFHTDGFCYQDVITEVRETLQPRGIVVDIDKQEQGNYEIWIRDDNENVLYMLFDCTGFIVEC